MKRLIQGTLRRFGYEIQKVRTDHWDGNAFAVQRELIAGEEVVIFDVGAHVGTVTSEYLALFPRAKVYCFEPFAESYDQLVKRHEGDARVSYQRMAVCDKKGKALFNVNAAAPTNSLLAWDSRGKDFQDERLYDLKFQVEVETTTIDSFMGEQGIPRIDILKLDVQGSEFEVFKGAMQALSQEKVSVIYAELLVVPTYEGQHRLHEYLGLLGSVGYELLDFFYPYRTGRQLIVADGVFVSPSLRKRMLQSVR